MWARRHSELHIEKARRKIKESKSGEKSAEKEGRDQEELAPLGAQVPRLEQDEEGGGRGWQNKKMPPQNSSSFSLQKTIFFSFFLSLSFIN
jgi:hypothetical protein